MQARHLSALFAFAGMYVPAYAHAEGGGLPQFDPTWFASQIFWLVITFATMFVVFAGLILPRIGATLQARRDRLEDDLRAADTASQTAASTQDTVQKNMQQAQAEAVSILATAGKDIATMTAHRHQTFREKAEGEIETLQAEITKNVKKAKSDIGTDVTSLVADVLNKTTGVKLAANDVQTLLQEKSKAA